MKQAFLQVKETKTDRKGNRYTANREIKLDFDVKTNRNAVTFYSAKLRN